MDKPIGKISSIEELQEAVIKENRKKGILLESWKAVLEQILEKPTNGNKEFHEQCNQLKTMIEFIDQMPENSESKAKIIHLLNAPISSKNLLIQELIPILIQYLKEEDANKCISALKILGELGPESCRAIPSIIERYSIEGSTIIADLAKETLEKIGKIGTPNLLQCLKNNNSAIRNLAIEMLREMKLESIPALIQTLKDKERTVQIAILETLEKMGAEAKEAIPALITCLQDKHNDNDIRCSAIKLLGKMGVDAKEAIPALIQTLKDKERTVQIAILETLEKMGAEAKEAIPALITCLQDKHNDNDIRCSAIKLLGKVGAEAKEAIPALITCFQDKISSVQSTAIEALEKMRADIKEAIPTLIQALQDKHNGIRCFAIKLLGEMGAEAKEAIPTLITCLQNKHNDNDIRCSAIKLLGKMGVDAKEAIPALIICLQNNDVRHYAIEALGKIGAEAKEAIPALFQILKDKEMAVQIATLEALRNIGIDTKGFFFELIRTPQDDNYSVQRLTIEALGIKELEKTGTEYKENIHNLNLCFQDKDPFARLSAINKFRKKVIDPIIFHDILNSLSFDRKKTYIINGKEMINEIRVNSILEKMRAEHKEDIPRLIQALEDENDDIQYLAITLLSKIGAKAIPALLERIQNRHQKIHDKKLYVNYGPVEYLKPTAPNGQIAAIKSLEKMGVEAIPTLIQALQDENLIVRDSAIKALEKMGAYIKEAIPALITCLQNKHNDNDIRCSAIKLLGKMGVEAKEAIPALITCLQDNDVRYYAIEALGKMGAEAKEAIPALITCLQNKHNDNDIRCSAIKLLGKMGVEAKEAIPALIICLQDNDVRYYAIESLGEMGADAKEAIPALIEALQDEHNVDYGLFASYFWNSKSIEAFIKAFEKIGPEAIPALIQTLKYKESDVRKASIKALIFLKKENAEEVIECLLNNFFSEKITPLFEEEAKNFLKQIGQASVFHLLRRFDENNLSSCRRIVDALVKIGPVAIPQLFKIIQRSEGNFIRIYSVLALGKIGADETHREEILNTLQLLAEDPSNDSWLRFESHQAWRKISQIQKK